MTDLSSTLLLNLLVFLAFPLIGSFFATKLKLSPLIGYIFGGIFLKLFFGDHLPKEFITQFSILGLVLLIFTIGLEANLSSIRKFGKFVFLGGILQLLFSSLFVFILSIIFKFTLIESIFFGIAFAMSSTAVIAKIIQERGEENSLTGGLAIGILILQDLALIPILVVFSSLSNSLDTFDTLKNIFLNSIKAVLILLFVYHLGQRFVPKIFNKLAKVSKEVLNLFTVVFILSVLSLFTLLHISPLLAAFLTGVLLGQTLGHQHIFSQIRPFRDLLVVVFFVSLGLTIQPVFIASNLFKILLFTILLIFLKWFVLLLIFLFFKFHSRTAFSLGAFLFQIGEGAFILIYQGMTAGLVSNNSYLFTIVVVLLTLILTPFIIAKKDTLYTKLKNLIKKSLPFLYKFIAYKLDRDHPGVDALSLKNHIVICGYGRVGRYIGRALILANIVFIAIDYNFHVVEKAKKEGVTIIYGDPTETDILDYAEVETATILILAVPEKFSQELIILTAKRLNPNIIIFTRVHREVDQIRMKDLGVDVVVQPEFEASLSIIRKILLLKRIPKEEIAGKIKRLKIEHGMV